MKVLITAGILATLCVGVWSCGASENAKEDILRLGGISSTGNKDEEPTSEGDRNDQHGELPAPNQAMVCENPIDLSGRSYLVLTESGAGTVCIGSERNSSCISEMNFIGKKEVSVSYLTDAADGQTTEAATYNLCGTTLGIRTGAVNVKGEFLTEFLRAKSDLTSIVDEASGLVFNRTR